MQIEIVNSEWVAIIMCNIYYGKKMHMVFREVKMATIHSWIFREKIYTIQKA